MAFKFPRPLGEINDKDTQFTAGLKKYQEFAIIGGVVVFLGIIFAGVSSYMGDGRTGGWKYGLCKVFLEQYSVYPNSLIILESYESQNSAMLRYLVTNPYGGQESQEMECFYNTSANNIQMSRVTVNKRSLNLIDNEENLLPDPSAEATPPTSYQDIFNLYETAENGAITGNVATIHINEFNKSIGSLLADENYETDMPSNIPQSYEDLKYD